MQAEQRHGGGQMGGHALAVQRRGHGIDVVGDEVEAHDAALQNHEGRPECRFGPAFASPCRREP